MHKQTAEHSCSGFYLQAGGLCVPCNSRDAFSPRWLPQVSSAGRLKPPHMLRTCLYLQKETFILLKVYIHCVYKDTMLEPASGTFQRAFFYNRPSKIPCKSKSQHFHLGGLNIIILKPKTACVKTSRKFSFFPKTI